MRAGQGPADPVLAEGLKRLASRGDLVGRLSARDLRGWELIQLAPKKPEDKDRFDGREKSAN
ncbi:hypothetical protein [Hoeflea ulvae]|uniref:Uncharacterized protein n=1 Tax=Hoeflea ulvae TaxID=2983764 RepID=A0ABT3YLL4_9HYPH|nr:hypothetical protein [Hoeflea ulvae]MCY0096781.1 hypothetical protein [Hoeflea ulvae]